MDPFKTGAMKRSHSEQRRPKCEKDLLGEQVKSQWAMIMIKLINETAELVKLKSAEYYAQTEQLDCNSGGANVDGQLN